MLALGECARARVSPACHDGGRPSPRALEHWLNGLARLLLLARAGADRRFLRHRRERRPRARLGREQPRAQAGELARCAEPSHAHTHRRRRRRRRRQKRCCARSLSAAAQTRVARARTTSSTRTRAAAGAGRRAGTHAAPSARSHARTHRRRRRRRRRKRCCARSFSAAAQTRAGGREQDCAEQQ